MAKFKFSLSEKAIYYQYGTVTVEADTLEEARELAEKGENNHQGNNEIDLETEEVVKRTIQEVLDEDDEDDDERKVVGYQVVDDDKNLHPAMIGSWVIMSKPEAMKMARVTNLNKSWSVPIIFEGDIEEPWRTFEGDCDNPTETGTYVECKNW